MDVRSPDHPVTGRAMVFLAAVVVAGLSLGTATGAGQEPPTSRAVGQAPVVATPPEQPDDAPQRPSRGEAPLAVRAASLDERQMLISAATEAAVDRLLRQIEVEPFIAGQTVGQFLGNLPGGARQRLRETLRSSPQVGGPRFASTRSVQVQLIARGDRIAETLLELARAHPGNPPLDLPAVERRLAGWRSRQFQACGSSVSPHLAERLRPEGLEHTAWSNVTQEEWNSLVTKAKQQAVSQVMGVAGQIELGTVTESTGDEANRQEPRVITLGELFDGSLGVESQQWLGEQPVTRIQLDAEGRELSVKLTVEPRAWAEQLRSSTERHPAGLPPVTEDRWTQIARELAETTPAATVGRVRRNAPPVPQPPERFRLPEQPPEWAELRFTATAEAPRVDAATRTTSQLLTKARADGLARDNLRRQLEAAPITPELTLKDLAERNRAIAQLIEDAVKRASVSGLNYNSAGDAEVRVSIEGAAVWRALQSRV